MTDHNTTDLIGLWVIVPSPGFEGFYRTGQITRSIGDDYHLVKFRPTIDNMPAFSRLVTNDDLCVDEAYAFDSEAELDEWLAAMEKIGERPRVVVLQPTPRETH